VLTRADQFFRLADGSPVNNRSGFYLVDILGEDADLKIEDDHRLVWLDPLRALTLMRHDSHAWAVACWLRRQVHA
jgi:8-oxo-dGTP diphosphatase